MMSNELKSLSVFDVLLDASSADLTYLLRLQDE